MHVLVIGGTGMLRGVSLAQVQVGNTVSVVARSHNKLAQLQRDAERLQGTLHPIAVDYTNGKQLREKLELAAAHLGSYTQAFCWIHSTAPQTPAVVASTLAHTSSGCVYMDICGSAVANPLHPAASNEHIIRNYPELQYRKVVLGFIIENTQSRWLTHSEITAGVLQAVENKDDTIVGVVHPWSAKP